MLLGTLSHYLLNGGICADISCAFLKVLPSFGNSILQYSDLNRKNIFLVGFELFYCIDFNWKNEKMISKKK